MRPLFLAASSCTQLCGPLLSRPIPLTCFTKCPTREDGGDVISRSPCHSSHARRPRRRPPARRFAYRPAGADWRGPLLRFVAEMGDPTTAIAHARQLQPDLVMIDIPIGGLETARGIRQQSSATRIIFRTGAVVGSHQATSGLAHTYVYRDTPPAAIATLIRALPADHDDAGSPPLDETPPLLDLPLRDPSAPSQSDPPPGRSAGRPTRRLRAPNPRTRTG